MTQTLAPSVEMLGNLPLQYVDGPDYCTVTDATGGAFALTVQPELMKLMEAALDTISHPVPTADAMAGRDALIEQCAKIADAEVLVWINGVAMTSCGTAYQAAAKNIATRIRALSPKPPSPTPTESPPYEGGTTSGYGLDPS